MKKKHIATCATPKGLGTSYIYQFEVIDGVLGRKRFRWRNDACERAYFAWRDEVRVTDGEAAITQVLKGTYIITLHLTIHSQTRPQSAVDAANRFMEALRTEGVDNAWNREAIDKALSDLDVSVSTAEKLAAISTPKQEVGCTGIVCQLEALYKRLERANKNNEFKNLTSRCS